MGVENRVENMAQAFVPQAFWNALNNQNLSDMCPPQWSIVVNDSGVQCSIFFENSENASTKSSNSSGVMSAISPGLKAVSPVMKNYVEEDKTSDDSFDVEIDNDTEITNRSSPIQKFIPPAETIQNTISQNQMPNIANLPLIQEFLGRQIAAATAAAQQAGQNNGISPGNDKTEAPCPGDLMLISQENRRRLVNLREEATANRLSVTAFIRRGALLYFDSDELALNRLHTLDQKRLNALELETKFYFGDIPQQLFRRTIAIQQSQIRSKKSNASENRVRFRQNNYNFSFNPNTLVGGNMGQQDLSSMPRAMTQMPTLQIAPTATALKMEP